MAHPRPERGVQPCRPIGGWCLALCLTLGMAPHAALAGDEAETPARTWGPAADWSLRGTASARIAGDINRSMQPGNHDTLLTTALDAGLVLDVETKRALFSFNTGLARTLFIGEDQPTTDNAERLDPRFSVNGSYRGKTYVLSGNFGFDFQPTSFTQADDTGILNDETTQLTVNYAASLALELDKITTLTLGTDAQLIDFTDPAPGLTATRTFGGSATWSRRLSETTSVNINGGVRHFRSDNPQRTRSQTFDLSTGISHQRTRRHKFGVNAGLSLVRTVEQFPGLPQATDFDLSATGGVTFEYLLKDQSLQLSLSQSVDPSSSGGLQVSTRLTGGYSWSINELESLSVNAGYSHRSAVSGTGTLQSLSFTPSYNLALTRDVSLSLGYSFRINENGQSGTAIGQQVFLALNYNFDILN